MYKAYLGYTLLNRFRRTRRQHDVDSAIELLTQAAAPALSGGYRRAAALSGLSHALQQRYETSRDPGDLDAAIGNLRTALDITDPGRAGQSPMLANLAEALQARFKLTNDPHDLDAAIALSRRAADAAPGDHTDRAIRLTKLGQVLLSRFENADEHGGNTEDLMESVKCCRAAADNATAPWETRIIAALAWSRVAERYLEPAMALEGYSAAVGLLPMTVWHGAERSAQEEQLTHWSGLAADAAACAITAGEPRRAVEMLEQGRSVLWAQALRLRSDVSRLQEQAPDLAARLEQIRDALDQPSISTLNDDFIQQVTESSTGARVARHHAAEDRRRLTRAWDDTVARVRRLHGFTHFLAPVPFPALQAAAQGGAVVMINVSRQACHALIIRGSGDPGVEVLALPDTSRADIAAQANKLTGVLNRARDISRPPPAKEADRDAVFDLLAWLWNTITGPVLDVLGHTSAHSDSSPWPRIWWCPTGLLTTLPLHAAGCYSRSPGQPASPPDTVPSRVISSYITTLGSLQRARQACTANPSHPRQLFVGMPLTPGQSPLPAVPEELRVAASYFPPPRQAHHLVGPDATRSALLDAIPEYPWAHFACHAYQNQADPLLSAFALHDGPVTLADLSNLHIHQGELAFLSACQTATGSVRLPDEAIHLAAVMQLLGYRHVIATLWTMADVPAPEVANIVYARLTASGQASPSHTAEALHHAVRTLRDKYPAYPLVWAPYIHIGP
jgi:hypothetical protein